MDIARYLARIGYSGPRTPSAQALRQLHRAHLFSIPFENLSIGWGEPIELNDVAHYWKIVECRRGGFCFEQNGLFAWALRELGYDVTLLAAEVYSNQPGHEGYGPEFSHLALRVDVDEPMLVDVGFGDSFVNPMVMRLGAIHREPPSREYRITEEGGRFALEMRQLSGEFKPRYRFALTPRHIDQFEVMCQFHQTSPESHFTQHRIVTLARPDGRITVVDQRCTETTADGVETTSYLEEYEIAEVLERRFGIVVPRAERQTL
jgi:N-hydroxyarylamine O-acetyltransferase